MRKKFTALVALLTAAICCMGTFTSCKKDGQKDTFEDTINWDNVDWEGNKDSSKKITVYISNDLQHYYDPKIEAFEKAYPQYEVSVHWGSAGDGVKTEQTTAISTGNPPDLILGGDVHIENQKGFLLPLNKLIERDAAEVQADDFIDGLMDPLQSGEGIYYLPTTFNVSVLMYNKGLFDKDGIDYPTADWTFDDFVAAGKQLTKYDSRGVATQWGNQTVTEWWTQWYSMLTMDGGSLFDDNGMVTLNNEAGIRALTNWRSLAGAQGATLNDFPNKIGTHSGSDGGSLGNFAGGKVAMYYSASCGELMTFSNANIDFDIAPLPKSTVTNSREGAELSITAYGIHKNSKNKKGAWQLLKYLTAPRTDLEELGDFALAVPRKSERDLLLAVPKAERTTKYKNLEVIYDAVSINKALPRVAYFEEVTLQYLVKEVNKLLENKSLSVASAAKTAQDTANSYISYRYKSDF